MSSMTSLEDQNPHLVKACNSARDAENACEEFQVHHHRTDGCILCAGLASLRCMLQHISKVLNELLCSGDTELAAKKATATPRASWSTLSWASPSQLPEHYEEVPKPFAQLRALADACRDFLDDHQPCNCTGCYELRSMIDNGLGKCLSITADLADLLLVRSTSVKPCGPRLAEFADTDEPDSSA